MAADTFIHPLAVVEPGAELGAGVSIGPFCHVGSDAVIGDRTCLLSHVVVSGSTRIGADCTLHPQSVIGGPPQSSGYKGEPTQLDIGESCLIREYVTINRGTVSGGGITRVGNRAHILAYAHIAHDCIVGNNVTMTNGTTLGGHCEIGDFVGIGGLVALHQFVRVAHNAFLAGGAKVDGDVGPYAIVAGDRAKLRGVNVVGMRRSGMPKDEIRAVRGAYRMIFDPAAPMAENLVRARTAFASSVAATKVVDFLSVRGKRPFVVPPLDARGDGGDDEPDATG